MEVMEEEASSCPAATFGAPGSHDIRDDIYGRLVEEENEEVTSNPAFREQLNAHFNRLPPSYLLDLSVDRAGDVLLHQKLLEEAKYPEKRPVFHVRFVKGNLQKFTRVPSMLRRCSGTGHGSMQSCTRNEDCAIDFEPCSKLEDLNLDVRKDAEDIYEQEDSLDASSTRQDALYSSVYEIIFTTLDRPKLLSQLSALLSDVGLDIREAHVFCTSDGYSLDVFVVDGSFGEDTDSLHKALKSALERSEGSLTGSSSSTSNEDPSIQARLGDQEINMRLLKMGEKIGRGSCGDQYRGSYMGQDVAIKVLRPENLSDALLAEFTHEVNVLRKIQHPNVVRFVGACTKRPQLCIVTEYMPGGSLYDFLRKHHAVLPLPLLLKLAIDICKGMDYLHQNNIIHRDLKSANLLLDKDKVAKVADFGVARFQDQEGIMTAETGTYRWMAPEVINHQPYNEKADVFSFAIVLWELATSKIPYDALTPLQAALGVRQGVRPELPESTHPKLLDLMRRCWETVPSDRPSFSHIKSELEELLRQALKFQVQPVRRRTSKQLKRQSS